MEMKQYQPLTNKWFLLMGSEELNIHESDNTAEHVSVEIVDGLL